MWFFISKMEIKKNHFSFQRYLIFSKSGSYSKTDLGGSYSTVNKYYSNIGENRSILIFHVKTVVQQ